MSVFTNNISTIQRHWQGGTTHCRYDICSQLIQSERPDGRIDRYQRNLAGHLTDYIDPTNLRTTYDATERLLDHRHSTLQNPELHCETYNYDAAANLLTTSPMGSYVKHNRVHVFEDKRYRYDRFGRLSEKRIGSLTVQRFRYYAEQRVI